jgi:hypothetical protein
MPDGELESLDAANWQPDVGARHAECERIRAAAVGKDLDCQGSRNGEPLSLRWICLHMIEEYSEQPVCPGQIRPHDREYPAQDRVVAHGPGAARPLSKM